MHTLKKYYNTLHYSKPNKSTYTHSTHSRTVLSIVETFTSNIKVKLVTSFWQFMDKLLENLLILNIQVKQMKEFDIHYLLPCK